MHTPMPPPLANPKAKGFVMTSKKATPAWISNVREAKITQTTKQKQQPFSLATTERSLYTQVLSGRASLQPIVDAWIKSYKKDKDTSMLELIQFVVRSSGCKMNDKEVLKSKEFTQSIKDLVVDFDRQPCLLVQDTDEALRFKDNFCKFLRLLIDQCLQLDIIYVEFMLDNMITFLIKSADSQIRVFRHTSTLAVLKIMTALVDAFLGQQENESQTPPLEQAANDRSRLRDSINSIFKDVFIHRHQDTCPNIRAVCTTEFNVWMSKCPSRFLDDTFREFIGWTLYDRVGECCLMCSPALESLDQQGDLLARLEFFTTRFKKRIFDKSIDKEFEVCVNAIELLTSIVSQNDAALEDMGCENIYNLAFHDNFQVAQAAGKFVEQKLFVKVENPPMKFRSGKEQTDNTNFIRLLVQFLIDRELHDHPAYLCDAMWDIHRMMKDWGCMTDLLLEAPLNQKDVLDDTAQRVLIQIIACCVKQAATGEGPPRKPTSHSIARRTQADPKQVQDDKVALTQHFIVTLPLLLDKYIADAEKLVHLLQIIVYFDLKQYAVPPSQENLEELLESFQKIVSKRDETEVLEECSKCLSLMCDKDNSVSSQCIDKVRSVIMGNLAKAFTESMSRFDQQSKANLDETHPLTVALRRLSAFADDHNIASYDLGSNTLTILKWAVVDEHPGQDFITNSLNLARSLLLWNLQKLEEEMGEGKESENSSTSVVAKLVELISELSKNYLGSCIKLFGKNPQIAEKAFIGICDVHVFLSSNMTDVQKEYEPLVLTCPGHVIDDLWVFVRNNVFNEDALNEVPDTSEKIEKRHKRRLVLGAFVKLICHSFVSIQYAAQVLRGYIKFAHIYGDIINSLLSTYREMNMVQTAEAIALALHLEFTAGVFNSNSPEFQDLKELAHRLCLSFGVEAIAAIHEEILRYVNGMSGVQQAIPPINLPLLELIVGFSSRLDAPDKDLLLDKLDKSFAERAKKGEENHWLPYYSYRASLMEEDSAQALAANQLTKETAATAATANAPSTLASTTAAGDDDDDIIVMRSPSGDTDSNARKRKQASSSSAFKDSTNSGGGGAAGKQLEETIPELEDEESELTTCFNKRKLNSTENASGLAINGASVRATRHSNRISNINKTGSDLVGSVGAGGNKRSSSPLMFTSSSKRKRHF